MELKHKVRASFALGLGGLNRTFMELKQWSFGLDAWIAWS